MTLCWGQISPLNPIILAYVNLEHCKMSQNKSIEGKIYKGHQSANKFFKNIYPRFQFSEYVHIEK